MGRDVALSVLVDGFLMNNRREFMQAAGADAPGSFSGRSPFPKS